MTTPLTIYRFGLCGNSVNESIGKHRFRTKKYQKVNKSSQKTTPNRFGYWRPGVRISTLRPRKNRQPLRLSVLFLMVRMPRTSLLRSRKEFAYPVRRSTSSLVRRMTRISSKRTPPHFDHMKIIRTFSSLKKRSDYLFYLSTPNLITRNKKQPIP